MVLAVMTSPVTHNLEPPKHLADAEKSHGLGTNDGRRRQGFPVHVSYPGEERLRAVDSSLGGALRCLLGGGHETGRVADGVSEWLEVSLDGLHGASPTVRTIVVFGGDGMLTEVPCHDLCK